MGNHRFYFNQNLTVIKVMQLTVSVSRCSYSLTISSGKHGSDIP